MAEDVIRAQRIELVDTDGNLSIVVDGGRTTEGGAPGLIVYGPDGPTSSIAFNVDRESGKPVLGLFDAGGGEITITFNRAGEASIYLTSEDGQTREITPSQDSL